MGLKILYVLGRITEVLVFLAAAAAVALAGYAARRFIWLRGEASEFMSLYRTGAVLIWFLASFLILLVSVLLLSVMWYWFDTLELASLKSLWALFRVLLFGLLVFFAVRGVLKVKGMIEDESIMVYVDRISLVFNDLYLKAWNALLSN